MTGEAHFLVDALALFHHGELRRCEGGRTAAAAASEGGRRRLENLIADLLHASGGIGRLRGAHRLGDVGRLQIVAAVSIA